MLDVLKFDNLDLNLLRVFDVLMRERNVSVAAERLFRTQSAISHSLSKLRLIFGDKLFIREEGVMNPTPKALQLADDISDALLKIRSTIDRHQQFDPAQTHAKFRVGMIDYHTMMFVPSLIDEIRKQAPYATLNLVPCSKEATGALIRSRQLDCAVVGALVGDDYSLVRKELEPDKMVCALWSGSNLLRTPLSLKAYLEATHIQLSADGLAEGLADRRLREMGLQRQVAATIPSYWMIPHVLRGTDFITHCGDSILHLLDERSEVVLVEPPIELPPLSNALVINRQMEFDPATLWLSSLVEMIFIRSQQRKYQK